MKLSDLLQVIKANTYIRIVKPAPKYEWDTVFDGKVGKLSYLVYLKYADYEVAKISGISHEFSTIVFLIELKVPSSEEASNERT